MWRNRYAGIVVATAVVASAFALATGSPAGAAQTDDAIANAGLVIRSDLPAGYAPSTDSNDSSPSGLGKAAKKIPACRVFANLFDTAMKRPKKATTDAQGDEFDAASGATASSETAVFASEAPAVATQAALEGPKVQQCFEPLMTTAVQKSVAQSAKNLPKREQKAARRVAVSVTNTPGPVPDAITYHVVTKIGALGGVAVFIDLVYVRSGRALDFYTFSDIGNPPSIENTVVPTVVARMAAAQA